MTSLNTLWSPIMFSPNTILYGCEFIASYSITISIFLICLVVHMQNEGKSSQMSNPFYDADLNEINIYVVCSIIFFIYMIGSSLLLRKGLHNNVRGFLLPWLIGMSFVIIFLYVWPIWLVYKYYIFIHMVTTSMIYWILGVLQFCGWLCVYAQYHMIDETQPPNVEDKIF